MRSKGLNVPFSRFPTTVIGNTSRNGTSKVTTPTYHIMLYNHYLSGEMNDDLDKYSFFFVLCICQSY